MHKKFIYKFLKISICQSTNERETESPIPPSPYFPSGPLVSILPSWSGSLFARVLFYYFPSLPIFLRFSLPPASRHSSSPHSYPDLSFIAVTVYDVAPVHEVRGIRYTIGCHPLFICRRISFPGKNVCHNLGF